MHVIMHERLHNGGIFGNIEGCLERFLSGGIVATMGITTGTQKSVNNSILYTI